MLEIGQGKGVAPDSLPKVEIVNILGPHSHPHLAIGVKFCAAKRTKVPVGPAKFDVNRCNDSPLRGEKPNFGL